jgi:PIN domain nuclease of toxin-antitoxin system
MPHLLLDTHIALWWFAGNPRLSAEVREEISHSVCWLSAVSIWEVAIKFRLGKLPVAPGIFLSAATSAEMRLLPITPEHAAATSELTAFHHDPFDRLLIAQARQDHLTLLTADQSLLAYGANVRLAA